MEYLIGLIGLLGGTVAYLYVKKQSAEGLLRNTDTKEKVLDLEKERAKLQAQAELESLRRDLENKNAEELKKKDVDPKDFN